MARNKLDQAAHDAGIALNFTNAKGEPESISDETKRALLAVMSTPDGKAPPLPPVQVFSARAKKQLTPLGSGEYTWQLQTESGKAFSGNAQGGEPFMLPPRLPQGYHQLTLSQGAQRWQTRIIIAPGRCYHPPAIEQGEKLWGALVQLYTLRSDDNWGIGDFGDLALMLEQVAAQGGDFIGLNPLHALYPAQPEFASPYSPTSRRWLNVLYIDVNQVAAFQRSKAAQSWWKLAKTRKTLKAARTSDWVDYSAVAELKLTALRFAWQEYQPHAAQDSDLQQFIADGAEHLRYQAAFDGILAERSQTHPDPWGWEQWPEGWRNARLPDVQQWCGEHEDEIQFWSWLQWLAQQQFAACCQRSQQLEMKVGLYRDLAVGVAQGSAETWQDPELYKLGASVGAPPDRLGPQGQNWALPPLDPHVMQARGYQPFIDLLRANMRDCGALRIDHVMALLRLWWIPYGETADKGAYVAYPVHDLLAILALESQRHRCMVIGEDLGTVPPEIVSMLRDSGVFSWKVLFFEQHADGSYRQPEAYPRQSIASASTHDLPTLMGFWQGEDLLLGHKLGLYTADALQSLDAQRDEQKQALLDALHSKETLRARHGKKASALSFTTPLNVGFHRYLADTQSALVGVQPEDWLGMTSPVNVPGTIDEYPNWRRKLSVTLENLFAGEARSVITAVNTGRRKK